MTQQSNPVVDSQPKPLPGKLEVKDALFDFTSPDDGRYNQIILHCAMKLDAGEMKYGSPLMSHNGRSADLDMYQDLLDSINYGIQATLEEKEASVIYQRTIEVFQVMEVAEKARLRLVEAGVLDREN